MTRIWADLRDVFGRRDNALRQLIIINVVVFVLIKLTELMAGLAGQAGWASRLSDYLSLPAQAPLLIQQPWALFTYFFAHANLWHIFWNLIIFYWFGQVLEMLGHGRRITAIYLFGGIGGGLVYLLFYNLFPGVFNPYGGTTYLIGASGAIYAVVVAAARQSPDYRFHLFLIGPVKIVYLAGAYVLISFLEVSGSNPGGNLAHLGGALIGYLYMVQLQRGRDWAQPVMALQDRLYRLFYHPGRRGGPMTVSRPNQRPVSVSQSKGYGNGGNGNRSSSRPMPPQDEVDALLDKIARVGYDKLSAEERDKLNRAAGRL